LPESIFDRKARVRPPRVHITYEVETGGAVVQKEIPFVLGVLSDLSGHRKTPLPKMQDRKFVEIDRDTFDDVLASAEPRLALRVQNELESDGKELPIELNFRKLADFRPEGVAEQVAPMKKLLEVRTRLKDLLGRLEGNDRLEELLEAIIEQQGLRDKLNEQLQARKPEAASDGGGE